MFLQPLQEFLLKFKRFPPAAQKDDFIVIESEKQEQQLQDELPVIIETSKISHHP